MILYQPLLLLVGIFLANIKNKTDAIIIANPLTILSSINISMATIAEK